MTDFPSRQTPMLAGWAIAAGVGVVAYGVTTVVMEFGFSQAVFVAAILFGVVGVILGLPAAEAASPVRAAPVVTPSQMVADPTPPQAAMAPAAAVSAPPAEVRSAEVKPAEVKLAEVAPAEVSAGGSRPATLAAPRDGVADDLKKIKGVGPKLEVMCNKMGFWHFDQVAAWTPAEIAWVDENLEGFKGRVSRDGWVEQAKLLAAGGSTEFSSRVDRGSVY